MNNDPSNPSDTSLLKRFLPIAIHILLNEGLINKKRLTDAKYVAKTINKNYEVIKKALSVITIMHDDFVKSAREAIDANRPEVAVVLIATAIEQNINMFYRDALTEQDLLSSDEITEFIRTTSFNAKISWLLAIIASEEIDADTRKGIAKIMEVRNQIVHYKAIPHSLRDKNPIQKNIEEFDLNKMLGLLDVFSEKLYEILEDMREESPEYKLVAQAAKTLIG